MTTSPTDTADLLTIEATYNGPPDSAHGGVAVGRFAAQVPPGPVEVRLLGPPPLDTPMTTREEDGGVVVTGPTGDVARVRSLDQPVVVGPFGAVDEDEVAAAADEFLARVAEEGHAFPTCFGCGPDRHDPGALRQFTGHASDGDTVTRFHVPGNGVLPRWLALAGLDCPSGQTMFTLGENTPAVAVLGSMQCQLDGEVSAGVDYQVRGRVTAVDGRKHTIEVAMLAPDATVVGQARALWIAVDAERFGAAVG